MSSVIVLTKSYAYWGERSLRDVLRLYVKGKIEIVRADENREIRAGFSRTGATFKMPAPLVVRLLDFVGIHIKSDKITWSKEAVYRRDKNVCQYYHIDEKGRRFRYTCKDEERSIDHVFPRCRGGEKDSFLNTVCACKTCNIKRKKAKTPAEAGMELIRLPEIPKLRKGDMVVMSFNFNPSNEAHRAFQELMGK
jgi:hypothetical protein